MALLLLLYSSISSASPPPHLHLLLSIAHPLLLMDYSSCVGHPPSSPIGTVFHSTMMVGGGFFWLLLLARICRCFITLFCRPSHDCEAFCPNCLCRSCRRIRRRHVASSDEESSQEDPQLAAPSPAATASPRRLQLVVDVAAWIVDNFMY